MVLDYITGVVYAYVNKNINSEIGFKGLLKKCLVLVVLIVAVMLDRLLNTGDWVFRTLVCYFYIANEGISLLENISKLGVPIPAKIKDALEQLNKEGTEYSFPYTPDQLVGQYFSVVSEEWDDR